MGVTKKAKITFTCEPSLKDGLEEWAQSESRILSNLIEMLIRQAYEERFSSADRTTDPHSILALIFKPSLRLRNCQMVKYTQSPKKSMGDWLIFDSCA